MNSSLIQLLVLAGIAIFLILKLRSVLGSREGFEKPPVPPAATQGKPLPIAPYFNDILEAYEKRVLN